LSGGSGNDSLYGGSGNDIYHYQPGDGIDTIDNRHGGYDILDFGDISADDLSFMQIENDLVIDVLNASGRVIVNNWFLDADNRIEAIACKNPYAGEEEEPDYIRILDEDVPYLLDTSLANTGKNVVLGLSQADQVVGSNGDDILYSYAGDDQLFGLDGNDLLEGGEGDDYLDGGAGNDTQGGGSGNDQLGGDTGDDTLIGGTGDDTYIYRPGSGADIVNNSDGGIDWLIFTDDLTSDRLSYLQNGDDLIIRIDNAETSQVTVTNWFLSTEYQLSYIQPAGQSGVSAATINALFEDSTDQGSGTETPPDSVFDTVVEGTESAEQVVGTSGSDLLQAFAGDDQLFGLSGDDWLEAGDGADYLDGGTGADTQLGGAGNDQLGGDPGNDTLIGGLGDDIYVYRPGSGVDTINNSDGGTDWLIFTDDLTADRLTYHRFGDDLQVKVEGGDWEMVTVKHWFDGDENKLSYIQPAGGYGISAATIETMLSPYPADGFDDLVAGTDNADVLNGDATDDQLCGYDGNDQLSGLAGADQLSGDDGDDILSGGTGDDSYVFNLGDGNDVISDESGSDTIFFGDEVATNSVAVFMDGDTLQIGYGSDDVITMADYSDSTTGNRIENITMLDGSTMTDADINQLIQDMSAYAVTEGISLDSLADVRQNEELMTMIAGSWQAA
jgi:Ca2+-binding RTX toxin-like protein